MMKKTLIALLLGQTVAASAYAWQDAADFTTPVEMAGKITNDGPIWQFQLPEATVNAAANLSHKQSEGVIDGEVWSVNTAIDLVYLQGQMKKMAVSKVDFTVPVVTITGKDGVQTTLTASVDNQSITIPAVGTKGSEGNIPGELTLSVAVGSAGAYSANGNIYVTRIADTSNPNNADAVTLLLASAAMTEGYPDYSDEENAADETHPINGVNPIDWLYENSDVRVDHNFVSTYSSRIKEMSLSFGSSQIPESWTAQLPVTITMK